jgi:hypothetical protein
MKSGIKTTEFWLTAATAVVTVLNASGLLPFVIPQETVLQIVGTVAAYVLSRGVAKINQ